jgi:hypothetical protein
VYSGKQSSFSNKGTATGWTYTLFKRQETTFLKGFTTSDFDQVENFIFIKVSELNQSGTTGMLKMQLCIGILKYVLLFPIDKEAQLKTKLKMKISGSS